MPDRLQRVLLEAWLRRGCIAWVLRPLAWIYGTLVRIRKTGYRCGWFQTRRLDVPVVVVGNVIAGGAGKTPVVIALVEHLRSRGWRPGVISRGYGRHNQECAEVRVSSAAIDVGDEALLIRQRCEVPVFVSSDRTLAGQALRRAHPEVNLIVCDDGLQHLALHRDIEVVVFDDRTIGNGWLLPAGPLREPWPRQCDLILSPASTIPDAFEIKRSLDRRVVASNGAHHPLHSLANKPLLAVAGIARPEQFFQMLRDEGLQLQETRALPDHFDFAEPLAARDPGLSLVCTEKDATKLWKHHPQALATPLVVDLPAAFYARLDQLLSATLSSSHTTSLDARDGQ